MSLWKMSRWIQHAYIVEGLGVQGLRLFCGQQLWQAIAGTSCRTRGSAEWPHQVPHYDNLLSPVEPPKFPWISKEEFVIRLLWPCSAFLGRTGSYTHHPSWNLVLELMRMGPNHWRPMDGSLMFKSSFSLMRGHLCERLRPQDFTPEFFKGHFTRLPPFFWGLVLYFRKKFRPFSWLPGLETGVSGLTPMLGSSPGSLGYVKGGGLDWSPDLEPTMLEIMNIWIFPQYIVLYERVYE